MDSFYPVVSLLAFLSGSCFGFYYAWRSGSFSTIEPETLRKAVSKPEPLRKAA